MKYAHLAKIDRTIRSSKNFEQLIISRDWGLDVIMKNGVSLVKRWGYFQMHETPEPQKIVEKAYYETKNLHGWAGHLIEAKP